MNSNSFSTIKTKSLEIKKIYEEINSKQGFQKWESQDYVLGMIGDCGDLCKLVMSKNNLRSNKSLNLDQDIEHELVDIFWSLIVIADELNIDLEVAANTQLDKLKSRIEKN